MNPVKWDRLTPIPTSKGVLMVSDGKTISVVHPNSMSDTGNVIDMLNASQIKGGGCVANDDGVEIYVFDREHTDFEILTGWKRKGMIACNKGTEAHYMAELAFNGMPFRYWEPECVVLEEFAKELVQRGIIAHETEKEIICVDADMAGSIDLILYDPGKGCLPHCRPQTKR